jgi:putative thioredoxin
MSERVQATTTARFAEQVLSASATNPVLVDFWAPWCGPCRALGPVLDEVASEFAGKLTVVKVNTDEEPALASQFQIRSIPAVKLFRDGRVAAEFLGAQPISAVRQFLAPHLPRQVDPLLASARVAAERGALAEAIAILRPIVEQDANDIDARRELARCLALSGATEEALSLLRALPPAVQSESQTLAAYALVHFAGLASSATAGSPHELRAGAARAVLGGSPDIAVESLLAHMQTDRRFASSDGREDLLRAFALFAHDDARVVGWRRRLAAMLN